METTTKTTTTTLDEWQLRVLKQQLHPPLQLLQLLQHHQLQLLLGRRRGLSRIKHDF